MSKDEIVTDFEGTVIEPGSELVFMEFGGRLARGRCLQPHLPGVFGAILVQSLIDPKRTCLPAPSHCVVVKQATKEEPHEPGTKAVS